jgi:hypothetical protein
MKRASWMTLACLAASCLTAVPPARAIPVKCDKSPYDVDLVVVHANGVFTDLAGAKANLESLRPLVDQQLGHQPYAISYAVAYNQVKGRLASFRKLIRERVPMSEARGIRMLRDLDEVPDWLRDELTRVAAERDLAGFDGDRSLARHVTMYREHLRKGRKVVVIAHSEGNMYANAAYRRLFDLEPKTPGERAFGIVGIASPAPQIAGDQFPPECPPAPPESNRKGEELGCYTTLDEDAIMGWVRRVLPDTAPANVFDETVGSSDGNRHDLVDVYLRNPAAREQILQHVSAFVAGFEPLAVASNDSLVSAYLEWDGDADLDLHVYENDGGGHVYSRFPDSEYGGNLEADDWDGPSAEQYYAECAVLEAGDLHFAVGYYEGSGHVNARLRVKVADLVRTYEGFLPEPLGEGSFRSPARIATLYVKNRDRRLDRRHMLVDEYDVELIATPAR